MDLSEFNGYASALDEGIDVDIVHPVTGKPLGITVRVAAYSSERVKAEARRLANEWRRKARPGKITTVEAEEGRTKAIVAASILRWSGVEMNGETLACTPDNVRRVIDDPNLAWFVQQIDAAAGDDAVFFR
jgi:hypothetical protein